MLEALKRVSGEVIHLPSRVVQTEIASRCGSSGSNWRSDTNLLLALW
jgi:hypothetical protein